MWVLFPGDPPVPVQGKNQALTFPQNMSTWMGMVAQGSWPLLPRPFPQSFPRPPLLTQCWRVWSLLCLGVSPTWTLHICRLNPKSDTTLAGRTPSVRTVALPAWRGSPHQQKGADNQPQNRAVPCGSCPSPFSLPAP